jgi:hypothetical protein
VLKTAAARLAIFRAGVASRADIANMPPLGEIPVSCRLVNGRWSVAGNTGELK